jgi:hypothetical protein
VFGISCEAHPLSSSYCFSHSSHILTICSQASGSIVGGDYDECQPSSQSLKSSKIIVYTIFMSCDNLIS